MLVTVIFDAVAAVTAAMALLAEVAVPLKLPPKDPVNDPDAIICVVVLVPSKASMMFVM